MNRILSKIQKRSLTFDFSKHIETRASPKTYDLDYLGYTNDHRFGCTEPFPFLTTETVDYIKKLTQNEQFLSKTKYSMPFAPCVLRNPAQNDDFLKAIIESPEIEHHLSKIVGEEVAWHWNPWDASNINISEKVETDELEAQVFDWHIDSQPLTLVINISEFPDESKGEEKPQGGSTLIRRRNGEVLELPHPTPGYATLFRGCSVFHKATAANYRRQTYVKTLTFKDPSQMDCDDMLWAAEYSDKIGQSEAYLHGRLDRFQKQFEYLKNNSGDNEKCERLLKTVDREMIVMRQFADSIFKMHAGEKYDLGFVGSSYKTQEEMEKALTGEGNRMF